ncbi:hypothetical protein CHH83_13715 [Bacillus sp. 7586-K]|nr:hypothetical protein CHH83_13715 [Bacillus sp. 7586-K]
MMLYITYGTVHYLIKLVEAHPDLNLRLMTNENTGILFHETDGKTIFNEPKSYEVLDSNGSLTAGSFAVFHHIPVSHEGKPLFEKLFSDRARIIEKQQGFSAIRVLRPTKNDTYIILTLWEKEQYYKAWVESDSYNEAYHKGLQEKSSFLQPSFVKKYYAISLEA